MAIDILIDLLSLAGFSALGVYVWLLRPPRPFWPVLPQLLAAAFCFVLGDAISALATSRAWEWVGLIVLYLGSLSIATLSFVLALAFAEFEGLSIGGFVKLGRAAAHTFIVASWIVVVTAPLHGRFATPLTGSRSNYLELWWVAALTAYAFILASVVLYGVVLVTRSGSGVRTRASLMLTAAVMPLVANLVYTQTSTPLPLDPTIVANSISMLLFVVGIYRSRLFSLLPGLMPQVLNRQPTGIVLLDGDGALVWSNAAARELAGLEGGQYERLLDELTRRLHPVGEASSHPLALDRLLEPGAGTRDSLCRYGPEDSLWLRIEVAHIPVARKSAVLLHLRDVSEQRRSEMERHRLERRMRESRHLESLGELTGGIAHDFNNLLTVILGNTKLANAEVPEGSEAWNQLGQINAATLRAADLVKQMLIYAGRTPAITEPIDISELIAECHMLLRALLPDGVRLDLDLEPGLPTVQGDPSQLFQTVANLVENAGEAVEGTDESDPLVRVHTCAVVAGEDDLAGAFIGGDQNPGERVLIEVTDNGSGIDDDSAAKIFEPFFSTKFTGRGLGLAVVLGVLRQHEGVLAFQSAPGRGATFKIWLPPGEQSAADERADLGGPEAGSTAPTPASPDNGHR